MNDRCPVRLAVQVIALLSASLGRGAAPVERGQNLVRNPGFEQGDAEWQAVGAGFEVDGTVAHAGQRSMRCRGESPDATHGARQVIALDPPLRHPFRVSGWARAENAIVGQDFDVYLDLHYDDGTPLWGQIARFQPGTHDWQRAAFDFGVAKPVRTIRVHVLFRKAQGTVWFDDIAVELLPFEFRDVRVVPGLYGGASLGFAATTTLPAAWTVTLTGPAGTLVEKQGPELPLRLLWSAPAGDAQALTGGACTLRFMATDSLQGQTISEARPVELARGQPAPYALWTESSMRRVLPHFFPTAVEAQPTARVALAQGEYESTQVVLLAAPGEQLREVRVELSDLVSADARNRIPASDLEWQQVGYVKMDKLWSSPAYPEAVPGWWPDPLLPVQTVNVPDGFAQPIWVTVHATPDRPAGDYTGTISVQPAGRPARIVELRVTVYDFALPAEGHLRTAFALMDGFLEQVYGKPLTPELRQRYGDFVLRHRLNPDDISRTSPPAIEDLLHYRDRGLNAFNVLNLVEERGNRTWVCWSPESVYTPAFKQRLTERLDPYVAQLRQHGLVNKAYIYTFDERGKEFNPIITEYFGMVKQRYPEIPTLTTAYIPQDPAQLQALNVDWICPLTAAYRYDQAEACRAAGQQVWAYVCLGPRYPFANWLADDPLIEARVIWWQAFQQKMDGFLYWGLNIWGRPHNDRPIDPATSPLLDWSITTGGDWDRLHGDGELLYAGKDGPIGCIRLANIRDGLEDYEYLWLLSRGAGDLELARSACLPVAADLTHFTRDPAVVAAQRQRLARVLAGHAPPAAATGPLPVDQLPQ